MHKKAILPLILMVSFLVFSCGKEDPQDQNINISQTAIEIDYEETFKLDATFIRDGYSPSGFIWESANPNIAAVRNDGTVTGLKVGTTTVTVLTADRLFSADCDVTVLPTNFLYLEPLLNFGQNRAYIRANETRTFLEEDDEAMYFTGENNKIFGVIYLFEETLYEVSIVALNINTQEEANLIAFLQQRYEILGTFNNFLLFENDEVVVGITKEENSYFVVYFPNDDPTGASNRVDKFQKLLKNRMPDLSIK